MSSVVSRPACLGLMTSMVVSWRPLPAIAGEITQRTNRRRGVRPTGAHQLRVPRRTRASVRRQRWASRRRTYTERGLGTGRGRLLFRHPSFRHRQGRLSSRRKRTFFDRRKSEGTQRQKRVRPMPVRSALHSRPRQHPSSDLVRVSVSTDRMDTCPALGGALSPVGFGGGTLFTSTGAVCVLRLCTERHGREAKAIVHCLRIRILMFSPSQHLRPTQIREVKPQRIHPRQPLHRTAG